MGSSRSAVLPIDPSTYYELRARQRCPDRRPLRARRDEAPGAHIRRVWRENREVYRKLPTMTHRLLTKRALQ